MDRKRRADRDSHATVAIVGAGPAGLGLARVLRDLAIPGVRILERERTGASFRRWPEGMRFISPSFPGNAFGLTDLNAITYDSSPAVLLGQEHPGGRDYARYLEQARQVLALPVETGVEVKGLAVDGDDILLRTNGGRIRARFVVWAAGQFQYPQDAPFPGAEHGIHTSRVRRWKDQPGEAALVIGGYESGLDAAIGLARAGKAVTLLSRTAHWESAAEPDPSLTLSPFTRERLEAARRRWPITLTGDVEVLGLERSGAEIRVLAADGRSWTTRTPPLLATGFTGSSALLGDWFERDETGAPLLTEQDESTVLPGLFLVGPEVRHGSHLFCFIYKFRQRFAVVARAIAGRLGLDSAALEPYRLNGMYLDDLGCCDAGDCLC